MKICVLVTWWTMQNFKIGDLKMNQKEMRKAVNEAVDAVEKVHGQQSFASREEEIEFYETVAQECTDLAESIQEELDEEEMDGEEDEDDG